MKPIYFIALTFVIIHSFGVASLSQIVRIEGQQMSSNDVLKQIERDAGLTIVNYAQDNYGFKQDYRHYVSVEKVFKALKEYYKEFNDTELVILNRGHGKYIIKSKNSNAVISEPADRSVHRKESHKIEDNIHSIEDFEEPMERVSNNETSKPKLPLLDVSIVEGKKTGDYQSKKDLVLDDLEPVSDEKLKNSTTISNNSLSDRANRVLGPLNDIDNRHFSNTGVLTGFLASPVLPNFLLGEGKSNIQIGTHIQIEERDDASTRETYDGELLSLNFSLSYGLSSDVEFVFEPKLAVHTGSFVLSNVGNRDLTFGLGETLIGLNYQPSIDLKVGQLMSGVRLKLPTGDSDKLLGTGGLDFGFFLSYQYEYSDYAFFIQPGIKIYEDHDIFNHLEVSNAFDISLGVNYIFNSKLAFGGKYSFSQSPFRQDHLASLYSDDVSVVSLSSLIEYWDELFRIDSQFGLSDTSAKFGLSLGWEKTF